jgi:diacylglycerol kinase family enzyme
MKYGIIINQSSGSYDKGKISKLRQLLDAHDIEFALHAVKGSDIAKTATSLAGTCDVLVAGGGDGSLGQVAAVAAQHGKIFGVLPFGTLNHFAGDLGLPSDLDKLVSILSKAKVKSIDFATVNDKVFLNNSSIGLYPELVFRREDREKRIGKWPAAVISFWQILLRPLACFDIDLTLDGHTQTLRTPFVWVGNNDYGIDKFGLNQRQRIDAGHLSVYVFFGRHRGSLAWHFVRILFGFPKGESALVYKAQEVSIAMAGGAVDASLDGEVMGLLLPLSYRVHPRALQVIVS